jgi:hypothetical protein
MSPGATNDSPSVRQITRRSALRAVGTGAVAVGAGGILVACSSGTKHAGGSATTSPGGESGSRVRAVSHGQDLTVGHVGPWALQGVPKGREILLSVGSAVKAAPRVTTYPGYAAPPSWIPSSAYVYNNDLSNHGGVTATRMVIDGWPVPAGTWICQFCDFQGTGVIIEGDVAGAGKPWPGVMFRGCRMRGPYLAPGFTNENTEVNNGITWYNFCDAGGVYCSDRDLGGSPCETVFTDQGNGGAASGLNKMRAIRNYLSLAPTFLGGDNSGDAFVENYIESCIPWFDPNGPRANYYHTNVMNNSGGQTATLWLRNHCSMSPQPACSPYYNPPTVIIQMAADGGSYPGTGFNIDGSQGYQMRDNYLGGASYNISFGVDKANTLADVSHVVCTGNRFTTHWFANSGVLGLSYKNPQFGVQGNSWSGNTWADDYGTGEWPRTRKYPAGDGPRAGKLITAP